MSGHENIYWEDFWGALKNIVESNGGYGEFSALMLEALDGGEHSEFIAELCERFNPYTVKSGIYEGFRSHLIIEARKEFCVFEKELEEEYVHRIASLGAAIDFDQINQDLEKRRRELELEFQEKLNDARELKVIYEIVQKRFFDDKQFRSQALENLKKDIDKSLESCETPLFYHMLLSRCSPDEIVEILAVKHFDDLIAELGEEIKNEIREKYEKVVAKEIKDELRRDKDFVARVKSDLVKEITSSLFL